ncbi:type IV pili methyl-accepting chemotaxis transducer N-terminal domain-containing protein [Pseudomonas profundi]|uniref:type IV pili methyl-accepting chemotaxis transducer N-terminal domain-containing protein n=1 Tax=Pseudomonas profundi TaxID=1981513 RepID=UPI00123923FC|nr:type IV pili methyl-accepting chemotaxis transducer N-terminal domain-containing protein [Pseudomonas profundi]
MTQDTIQSTDVSGTADTKPRHSIVSRAIIACAIIICITLLGILGNSYVTSALEGDAEAINVAGSLRMQAWRLAATADADSARLQSHVEKMQATLESPILQAAMDRHRASALPALHEAVVDHWQRGMRPLLVDKTPQIQSLGEQVPVFVNLLDGIVATLQRLSERNLAMIQRVQLGTLLVVLLSTCALILDLRKHLATPLRQLTALAHQVSRGDFTGRMRAGSGTELDLLASTLNKMNEELASLYADMETKVNDKTAELTRTNAALHLLFESARTLYNQPADPVRMMARSLAAVRQALGCGPVSLCLNSGAGGGNYAAVTSEGSEPPHYCKLSSCAECPADLADSGLECMDRLTSFELHSGSTHLGSLRVEQPVGEPLQAWQEQVLVTLADLYAASMSLANLGQQQARLALMEERAVIARELHDSLAQALSAQKLQLARLKRQVENGCGPSELAETREQIEQGLAAAYRQLRELLTTFRIQVNEPGLKPALQATVKEFSRNSGVDITLDYQLDHCPLSPNEEVHCLQIAREALSNVIKHAQAGQCWIQLKQDDKGIVSVQVEDDGIGIAETTSPEGHYGLSILHERASSLGGTLHIYRREAGGTKILVNFPPDYRIVVPREHAAHE